MMEKLFEQAEWKFFKFREIEEALLHAKNGGIAIHDTGFSFRHWKLTAHIFAQNTEDLKRAIIRMGGRTKWIQYPGNPKREHWDAFGKPLENGLSYVTNKENIEWCERS